MLTVLVIWGFDFIAIEYMMQYASAGTYTLIRLMIGSTVLTVIAFVKKGGIKIEKSDWLRVAICGITAMSLYFTLENFGIKLTSASFGSLILATVPIFGMVGDRIVYNRKITVTKLVCIISSIVGVYLLVAGDFSYSRLAGLAFVLTAAILWAFQIIYVKPLCGKYDMLTILSGMFLSGMLFQVPITLITGFEFEATAMSIGVTVLTTIVCLVIGEAGYLYAVGNLPVTTVASFENFIPVITILLSFIIYGTTLTFVQFFGAAIIISAVMFIAVRE